MTAHNLDLKLTNTNSVETEEEYSIPLDISDIINICREYNQLGWNIQSQVENILESGVDEAIKTGTVKRESLPKIKSFLKAISRNAYFGDAVSQAHDCIRLIQEHEAVNKVAIQVNLN